MTPLSQLVDEKLAEDLREAIARGDFPGLEYQQAMELLLTDGIVPASGLPVASVLALEDWVRRRASSIEVASGSAGGRLGRDS